MDKANAIAALNEPMPENDAGAVTVKDYFKELLRGVLRDGEYFSGKRPFGNSGWEHEIIKPLILGGFVKGDLDSEGYVERYIQADLTVAFDAMVDAL